MNEEKYKERKQYFESLTQQEIYKRFSLLTVDDQKQLKRYTRWVLLNQIPLDDYDREEWRNIKYQLYSLPIQLLAAKFITSNLNITPQALKSKPYAVKFLGRLINLTRGSILLLPSIFYLSHCNSTYGLKIGYKHLMLDEYKKELID